MRDCLGGERFARALRTDQKHAAGERQTVTLGLVTESQLALLQPVFEGVKAADVGGAGFGGAILQQFATSDRLPLLLQYLGEVGFTELPPAGQCPGGHLADALLGEATAAVGQLLQQGRLRRPAAGLADVGEQLADFRRAGQGAAPAL